MAKRPPFAPEPAGAPDRAAQALQQGAAGYLHKASAPRELIPAVVAASRGRRFLGASVDGPSRS